MPSQSFELLEKMMSGQQVAPNDIDSLLNGRVDEDLFLDYKHGSELLKRNSPATIRQYLSGFANSAGGVLLIGIDESHWSITGCEAPGGSDLADWASRCISTIAAYFSPPPRFQVILHPHGNVLIAAVDRSLSLVPIVENGSLVYYLRVHDQTLKAPEYLMSDLLLGRRSRPDLQIKQLQTMGLSTTLLKNPDGLAVQFDLRSLVENRNLAWADDARLGIVSWFTTEINEDKPVSDHLLTYVDVVRIDDKLLSRDCHLEHRVAKLGTIGAFDTVNRNVLSSHALPLRSEYTWFQYSWQAALYIVSQNAPPIWYELTIDVGQDLLALANDQGMLSAGDRLFQLARVINRRPKIAWSNIQRSG